MANPQAAAEIPMDEQQDVDPPPTSQQPPTGLEATDTVEMQLLVMTDIPVGEDNHTLKKLEPIIEGLKGFGGGLNKLEVARLLEKLMQTPPDQPIPFSVLGPTADPKIVYAIPDIRAIPYEEGSGGMAPRQPKPQQETKHFRLFEKDEFAPIYHKDNSYRECKHMNVAGEKCHLGRCTVRRKDYLEGCFKHPLTFNIETKTLVDYHQDEARCITEEKKATQVRRIDRKKRQRARTQAPMTPAKIAAITQAALTVPLSWTKGCNAQYKGIFTYLTIVRAGYDHCIVHINSNYRRMTKTQWHAIGYGDILDEPGQLGILFGSRRHKFLSREHPKFLQYHGAVYSDESPGPIYKANDTVMKYYSQILQDDEQHKHLPWSTLLTVGMILQAEIVPAELYGIEGWKPGDGRTQRPTEWQK